MIKLPSLLWNHINCPKNPYKDFRNFTPNSIFNKKCRKCGIPKSKLQKSDTPASWGKISIEEDIKEDCKNCLYKAFADDNKGLMQDWLAVNVQYSILEDKKDIQKRS